MQKSVLYLAYLLTALVLLACRRPAPTAARQQKWGASHSVDFNQELSVRENLKINTFLAHYTHLHMQTSQSGLRYMIYDKAPKNTPLAKDGHRP